MGIVTGLAAAAAWLILWPIAWTALGLPVPVGVLVWVLGLAASFAAGVRFADPRWRTDPVSRIEARRRARHRFEARAQRLQTQERLARVARADREADARAEARVRELVERRHAHRIAGAAPARDAGDQAEAAGMPAPGARAGRDLGDDPAP